ncbi:MAG: GAF domain-containing protein [Anaerolineales bacterium]|nr:GAF domain-containing protein [Anaerolineales bacterium]
MVSPVTQSQVQEDNVEFQGSLGRRLALILLPLVLIPLIAMGVGAYLRSRELLEVQATSQMSAAAQAQVAVLEEWANVRQQRLLLGSQRATLRNAVAGMLGENAGSDGYQSAHQAALEELSDLRLRQGQVLFSDLAVIQADDGTILAATNESWPAQMPLTFMDLDELTMETETRPVFDDAVVAPGSLAFYTTASFTLGDGTTIYLVGVNHSTRIAALLEEMQVFWERRGVYRVERGRTFVLLAPDILIQLPRNATVPEAFPGHAHPVFTSVDQQPSGTMEYINANGDLVLSAYEWIPEWGIGIVTELPQSDIFAEVNSLAPFSIALAGAAGLITVLAVTFAASRLLRPLGSLSELADRLTQGDWTYRVPVDRNDELGALAFSLNQMAEELSSVYRSLEERVEERTRQIRTASEVARAVISSPSLDDLLRRAVELIRQQFNFDYVSIFLIEEEGDFVQLQEATGDIGGALKAQGYIVPVGSPSIIGWVTSNNQPRLISDIQPDSAALRRDLMPDTRSELAVPLQTSGRVLGAIDVQSSSRDAFRQQDIEVLQTLADQLSAAILNARLAELSAIAADRARLVSEVTRELSGPMEVDEVLERAAKALQRGLGNPEVMVKIYTGQSYGVVLPPAEAGD